MKLILYTNSSDQKKIGKNLAEVATLDPIYWKEDTNILHPVFTFHKFQDNNGNMIWKNFNYCKLVWHGFKDRYYFVDQFNLNKGGIIEIHCSIDVRETWKDEILGQNYLVSRQEHIYNKIIPDERKKIPLTRQVNTVNLGTVGDGGDGTIVLTISG